jgi:hypothetical protein
MAVRSVKKPQPQAVQPDPGAAQAEPKGEQIRERIREAAYYRAQQRGFSPGYEMEDWLAAEAEIRNRGAGA